MLPEAIGARIQRLREARGWSQEMLASLMQNRDHRTLTRQRIQDIEHGRRKVRPEETVSFARVFGIPITELLGVPDHKRE